MIELCCGCATPRQVSEAAVGKRLRCPDCGQTMHVVSAEALAEGNGAGDFDAVLTVLAGPGDVGVRFLLGGVADIQIGKLADRHIVLPGNRVSRGHCALVRIDFGPSRWKLVDNRSTNGVLVNGQPVAERELQDGDVITIGEYQLAFARASGAQAPLAAVAFVPPPDGPPCPSCEQRLPRNATICVDCGIHLKSGRPLLTSHDLDEEALAESAARWLRWVSVLVWVTPMPIPIRSQAFATRKPYAIWTIAAVTALASLIFFVAQSTDPWAGRNFMLWPPGNHPITAQSILGPARIHQLARKMTPDERGEFRQELQDPEGRLSDDKLVEREMDKVLAEKIPRGHFAWYQLVTHAFLHDTGSLRRFILHLGGNLLFMLVFGSRVNALIGDLATAILYPILAVAAASVQLLSIGDGPGVPMLGASGAIMGLAGMYLILFPAHKVYCAMWFSVWVWIRRIFFSFQVPRKRGFWVFPMRGFWLLLIYFGYDLLMNAISAGLSQQGGAGGVAHWAHVGGFVTGMLIGVLLLFSRMFNTRGGDVLSITLGKYAWPLIGKPARWHAATPAAATPVGFPSATRYP